MQTLATHIRINLRTAQVAIKTSVNSELVLQFGSLLFLYLVARMKDM